MSNNSNKENDEIILNHYKKVARNHSLGSECTIQDPRIREAESFFILESIRRFINESSKPVNELKVLDAGCGNGHFTIHHFRRIPRIKFIWH